MIVQGNNTTTLRKGILNAAMFLKVKAVNWVDSNKYSLYRYLQGNFPHSKSAAGFAVLTFVKPQKQSIYSVRILALKLHYSMNMILAKLIFIQNLEI